MVLELADPKDFEKLFIDDQYLKNGIVVDTSFLIACAYKEHKHYEVARSFFEVIEDYQIPVVSNVTTRTEFLHFLICKTIADKTIQLLKEDLFEITDRDFFNWLKKKESSKKSENRKGNVYRFSDGEVKKLKKFLISADPKLWTLFCEKSYGDFLVKEWSFYEDEISLNFIEILEGKTDSNFPQGLYWNDLMKLAADTGLMINDAMIINFFNSSIFNLYISIDNDFKDLHYLNANKKIIKLVTEE